ncbi:hypothetical protein [Polaribacter sp. Asnod6-C07]|uniref:hypothetical protein n=1 Tax=Polaribacter sp. Asnod6-C07 TaxID=3160582 RepID=UPI003868433D
MNWIKKLLGIDDIQSKLTRIEKNNDTLISSFEKKSKENEVQNFNSLNLLNPVLETNIFSFEKFDQIIPIQEKKLIDSNPSKILRAISSIPEFVSAGLLSQSFRFNFPKGVSGNVMKMAEGQGTAITDASGKILAHGNYISNFAIALPFIGLSIANAIIKEHYLSKINDNLEKINENIESLIELEFIKKEVKIQSIIFFFRKAFTEFDLINDNDNYRNAILTNIVNKNIEIYELIQFYKKAINTIDKVKDKKLSNSLNYLLSLQELYVFGKILEFKYANQYSRDLVTILQSEFDDLQKDYVKFFNENNEKINSLKSSVQYTILDNKLFFGSWVGSKKSKTEKLENLSKSTIIIDQLITRSQDIFKEKNELLDIFIREIEKPQEYYIEKGKLYGT